MRSGSRKRCSRTSSWTTTPRRSRSPHSATSAARWAPRCWSRRTAERHQRVNPIVEAEGPLLAFVRLDDLGSGARPGLHAALKVSLEVDRGVLTREVAAVLLGT